MSELLSRLWLDHETEQRLLGELRATPRSNTAIEIWST